MAWHPVGEYGLICGSEGTLLVFNNRPFTLNSINDTSVYSGNQFSIKITADDPDGDANYWIAEDSIFNFVGGDTIMLNTNANHIGEHIINVYASDGFHWYNISFILTVEQGPSDKRDMDADYLKDSWEEEYFGDLNQTGDGDYDQDGYTNKVEHDFHTDPTNSTSFPENYNDPNDIPEEDGNETPGFGFGLMFFALIISIIAFKKRK